MQAVHIAVVLRPDADRRVVHGDKSTRDRNWDQCHSTERSQPQVDHTTAALAPPRAGTEQKKPYLVGRFGPNLYGISTAYDLEPALSFTTSHIALLLLLLSLSLFVAASLLPVIFVVGHDMLRRLCVGPLSASPPLISLASCCCCRCRCSLLPCCCLSSSLSDMTCRADCA